MAITKRIVEMMNGEIYVESEKNIGTTFIVNITLMDSERKIVSDSEEIKLLPQDMKVLVIDVIIDWQMPEMDGLTATRTIRGLKCLDAKKIPIIALTANAFDEDVQQSLQAGLNAHLSKPVEPEVLFETLEKLIKD